ncbi:hypothetical protein H9623_15210 [Oerskovia sp. Sa1BUA8]|uniref:Uncharacterized protein n=2 Tax=Oerskovia TaxID=162491 RepID=A0A9D5UB56_9CELL|nr:MULTISPECIES: hypothetical protein [Oerskovia]MBD7981542.1 hypothetical protein [Oerskovia merdavium]MBE7701640.1 hypothetical protein [Oerskovia douganii]
MPEETIASNPSSAEGATTGEPAGHAPPPTLPLTRQQLTAAAARAGIGYAAGLVVALLAVVALGISMATTDASSWSGGSDVSVDGLGAVLTLPFLFVGMALLGPLNASLVGQGSASVFLAPLSITAVIMAGILLWTVVRRRTTDAVAPRAPRTLWLESLVTGGVLGLGGAILAAVFRFSQSTGDGLFQYAFTTGVNAFGVFAGGILVGTTAAALGLALRSPQPGLTALGIPVPAVVRRSADALLVGAVPAVGLTLIILLIAGVARLGLGETITGVLTVLPNVLVLGLGVASLGGIQASASGGGAAAGYVATLSSEGVPAWAWLAVLIPVIAVVAAGTRLRLVARDPLPWSAAWATPLVLAAVTLLATLVSGVRAVGSASAGLLGSAAGEAALHLAVWTALVAAAWGLLVEVVARRFAPWVVAVLPPRLVNLLSTTRTTTEPPGGSDSGTAGDGTAPPAPAVQSAPSGADPHPGADDVPAGSAPSSLPTTPEAGPPTLPAVDRKKALIVLGTVGAGIIVVVGAAVARNVVASTVYSPSAPVEAYLDALERGDAQAALALADPDVPNSERTLLTNDVYGGVAERPTGATITDIERFEDIATITATYDQEGRKSTQTFTVRRTGAELLVFDRWELVAPEVPVVDLASVANQQLGTVVVNGVDVDLAPSGSPAFRALPGRWEVTLPDVGELQSAPTLTFTVGGPGDVWSDGPDDEVLGYSFTSEALDAAEAAARADLDACVASPEAEPEGCELADFSYRADEVTGAAWAVTTDPTFTATDDGPSITVEVRDGQVTRTGTMPPGGGWFAETEPTPYSYERDLRYSTTYVIGQDGKLVIGEGIWDW